MNRLTEQALQLHRAGKLAQAEALYRQALAADPHAFDAHHLLGILRAQSGRAAEALADFEAALALQPNDPDVLLNRANSLVALGRRADALAGFDAAITARPGWAQALNSRGSLLQELRRPADAVKSYDEALVREPGIPAAWNNRGSAFMDMHRFLEALDSFDRALTLRPNDAVVLNNRGNALQGLTRWQDAVEAYSRALAIEPRYAKALGNRAGARQQLKQHGAALADFEAALRLEPQHPHAFGGAATSARDLCDWDRVEAFACEMPARVMAGENIPPWTLLSYSDDPVLQRRCAENAIRRRFAIAPPQLPPARFVHDRLRIGYLSSDFNRHPVTQQLVQVIEKHDRTRFIITGFSTGPDDGSADRARMTAACDAFHQVKGETPDAIARRIRADEIDILVDLNGHTMGDGFEVLARRPAAVQAGWLGYAGTTGATFIDHCIADGVVAPDAGAFSEDLARLPHCFFPHDDTRTVGPAPSRTDCGLPPTGFVFCAFNQAWKFRRDVFAIWLRLLAQVDGSVLWLRQPAEAEANLRKAARDAGIDPARLVFTGYVTPEQHLARHQCADLFLDTLPYNAHATAADALWAGLPVLTCEGHAYAGRVASSLLRALEMPELVTHTLQEYETLALALARDPARLAAIRTKLADKRATAPLFDTTRFTRDLEALYLRLSGSPP